MSQTASKTAVLVCPTCGKATSQELPPPWDHFDPDNIFKPWPRCCNEAMALRDSLPLP